MRHRIFIVGCAKTGTTLMRRLLYALDSVEIVPDEIHIDDFVRKTTEKDVLVGKRTIDSVFADIMPEKEQRRQINLMLRYMVYVIYVDRKTDEVIYKHGRVRVSTARLRACRSQAKRFRVIISRHVMYDDMINDAPRVVAAIAEDLRLTLAHDVADYPDFVPDVEFSQPHLNKDGYERRPIAGRSANH